MEQQKQIRPGQRVRLLRPEFSGWCGVVEIAEDERQVANVTLDQPCKYETMEEDYDCLEVLDR
jgi:hypothetical protein